MRRALRLIGIALLVAPLVLAVAGAAQDPKTAKGTVTAVGPDSVTVKAGDSEMKFTVDNQTEVIARGGGTKARMAQQAGKSGPTIAEVVKVGDSVEVQYHEMGSMLHAARIVGVKAGSPPGAPAPAKPKTQTASGAVSAVSDTSLTVKSGDQEWTFTVDTKTSVIGPGAGTKAREAKAKGAALTITDVVQTGDKVTVTYHDMGDTKHAATVRVTAKG